jgi:hypothetical protein
MLQRSEYAVCKTCNHIYSMGEHKSKKPCCHALSSSLGGVRYLKVIDAEQLKRQRPKGKVRYNSPCMTSLLLQRREQTASREMLVELSASSGPSR